MAGGDSSKKYGGGTIGPSRLSGFEQESVKIQRLDHVGIEVRDLDTSEPFYRDLLGLRACE